MDSKPLETKSLEELRALARTAGLRGYSGLRKKQLIELLAEHKVRPSALESPGMPTAKKAAKSQTPRTKAPSRGRAAGQPAASAPTAAPASVAPAPAPTVSTEERIESAKYAMTLPGLAYAQAFTSTLHEDIDSLPSLGEPVLCLLPQRPGVVHAYWVLQPGAQTKHLRLRLCLARNGSIDLVDEVSITGERGHWYFHVPQDSETGNFFAHLGYYDAGGNFVTAIARGIARIPSLYASSHTDRSWWISDEDFRAMYLRAGGAISGRRLLWSAAAGSSPMNAPSSSAK